MKNDHQFLLKKNNWLGEGKIKLSMASEPLTFYMRWKIEPEESSGIIECFQEIQVVGHSDVMCNEFHISDISKDHFTLFLENPSMGKIQGKGIVNDATIGWELSDPNTQFEGFEFYQKQDDGSYFMHAEYATGDFLKTEIQGKIWIAQTSE